MKVLCDYQIYIRQKIGGISRYFAEISHRMPLLEQDVSAVNKVLFPCNYYLCKQEGRKRYQYNQNKLIRSISLLFNDVYTFFCIYFAYLRGKPYDIVHITWYKPFYLDAVKKLCSKHPPKMVMTVYDLIHERECASHPKYQSGVQDRKKMLGYADGIICISEHTKKDLLSFYPDLNPDRIKVIYLATDDEVKTEAAECALPARFVLFVGRRQGYKNFRNFIKAMHDLVSDQDLYIVCAGGGPFTAEEQKLIDENWDKERIIQRFFSDDELVTCYRKALCFVFPSLYEGFGIPILEAFSNGCPAAISNASCFPEIAENAAAYFDGNRVEEIAACLKKLIYDQDMLQEYRLRGAQRFRAFSWNKTSSETIAYYRTVLNDKTGGGKRV